MGIHPKFDIVQDRKSYFVRENGKVVYGPTCHNNAHDALERLKRKAKHKVRKCVTCSANFTSEGPHNRMCNSCRSQSLYDGAA